MELKIEKEGLCANVIIDGKIAYCGGDNLADEYINAYEKYIIEIYKSICNNSCNLSNLKCMSHSGSEMFILRGKEHLCLMHKPAKSLGMYYPVSVPLKLGSVLTGRMGIISSSGINRQKGVFRQG